VAYRQDQRFRARPGYSATPGRVNAGRRPAKDPEGSPQKPSSSCAEGYFFWLVGVGSARFAGGVGGGAAAAAAAGGPGGGAVFT
jgi:hypothetical protein